MKLKINPITTLIVVTIYTYCLRLLFFELLLDFHSAHHPDYRFLNFAFFFCYTCSYDRNKF